MIRGIPVIALALVTAFCAPKSAPRSTALPTAPVDLDALWIDPLDLESRDLYHGPGGKALTPDADARYNIVGLDRTGYSRGYDVRDAQGREWSVKIGPEAQSEVVASRILWAIGYHQPPTYLLVNWRADDAKAQTGGAARFRPSLETAKTTGDWSWYENPFVGTRPFNGLVVANLLLNNWDFRTSNNKVYEVLDRSDGPRYRFVVRDLGAAFGKTTYPPLFAWTPLQRAAQGTRNDLEGFESQGFIESVDGERVEFAYTGRHPNLVKHLTVDDVVWACTLMDRLSDEQIAHAFRAGGYTPEYQRRYATALRARIQQGKTLTRG
jgi:hypothetical protein